MEKKNYESVFKNPAGFNQQEINQMRIKVMNFSQALGGRRLAIPVSDNLDLNYKKKVAGDIPGLYTATPLKKYHMETVDLFNIDIVKLANGKPVIMFNNDEKLQFDLRSDIATITSATPHDVHEAIKKYEASGEKTFFVNVAMVTETVESLNKSTINDISSFIDELANLGISLEGINKTIKEDTDGYYKSIGG